MVLLLLLSGHELNTIVRFPEHHSKAQTFLDISPHHTIPYPSVHSRVSAKSPAQSKSCATIVLTRMIADYIARTHIHPSILPIRPSTKMARISEGQLMPNSWRWKDIRAWYSDHFTVKSTWGKV